MPSAVLAHLRDRQVADCAEAGVGVSHIRKPTVASLLAASRADHQGVLRADAAGTRIGRRAAHDAAGLLGGAWLSVTGAERLDGHDLGALDLLAARGDRVADEGRGGIAGQPDAQASGRGRTTPG